jgi:CMP-N-acetylneuraminic acid synthetase
MHTLSYHLLPTVYIQNASIYITKPSTIWQKKSPIGDVVIPFVMYESESIDINSPLDFYYADFMARKNSETK